MEKPRILLTYIESGFGHIMSMKSIADGLKNKYQDKMDIIESYIMEQGDTKTEEFEKFLSACTKATNKKKWFGMGIFVFLELAGKQHFMRIIHKTLFKKYTDATIEQLRKFKPDVIVSTHYFITFAAIELKKRYIPNLTIITYNPDNNVHVWWDNRTDLFINNNLAACDEAIKRRNFKFSNVKRVFFTSREEIVESNLTKEEYRQKLNLPINNFTIILADGGYASAKAKKFTNALLKLKINVTIIILAGKNEKVYKYFQNKVKKVKPNITLIPLGFKDNAYEYYGASDIFITKSGPNAVLDSLFMGTPVIIDYYAHPIEKATCKLFTEILHCGIKCLKVFKIKKLIMYLYEHPSFIQALKDNINKNVNKKNNGAEQIADIIYTEMHERGLL